MKKVDWGKAPEGFPVWIEDLRPDLGCDMSGWFRYEYGRWVNKEGSNYWEGGAEDRGAIRVHRAPAQWTGPEDGLPPVGTVCEIHGTIYEELRQREFSWRKVEIIAHTNFGGDYIAVGRDLECATLGWGIAKKFRPIRTPEQIAAEERERAIKEMMDIPPFNYDGDRQFAELLYEAGYRKCSE